MPHRQHPALRRPAGVPDPGAARGEAPSAKRLLPARCCLLAILAALAAAGEDGAPVKPAGPPNIIIYLADDLGWGDLGCYGAKTIASPEIDGIAQKALRLTACYAHGSPAQTRAAVLTGRRPEAVGDWQADGGGRLKSGVPTLARALKAKGYSTYYIGVWGLGGGEHLPTRHGFDAFYGLAEERRADTTLTVVDPDEEKPVWKLAMPGKRLAHEAMVDQWEQATREAIIHRGQNRTDGWLIVVGLGIPAYPQVPPQRFRGVSPAGSYGDEIAALDGAVGRIQAQIRAVSGNRKGAIADPKAIQVVVSTGGRPGKFVIRIIDGVPEPAEQSPLRGASGSAWEGGRRVPCLLRVPNRTTAGVTSDAVVAVEDLAATLAGLAGAALDTGGDGRDLRPLIVEPTKEVREHLLYRQAGTGIGVRQGQWKLLAVDGAWQLFDLAKDQAEAKDQAPAQPEVVAKLKALIEAERGTAK